MNTPKNTPKNKLNTNRKSRRGQYGIIGAPPKTVKWPSTPFTMTQLFDRNSEGENAQCELSLRKKVIAQLETGEIVQLKSIKQSGGAAGRPKARFVLKEHFDSEKHTLFGENINTVRAVKATKTRKTRMIEVPVETAVETVTETPIVETNPTVVAETNPIVVTEVVETVTETPTSVVEQFVA